MLGAYAALGDPPLPHHVVGSELTFEPKGNVAFDTDLGTRLKAICLGDKPVQGGASVAALTLDYGACSKHGLKLVPAAFDPKSHCTASGVEAVLRVDDVPLGCGAQFLITDRTGKIEPVPVTGEALLLLSGRAKILGDLRLAAFEATKSETIGAVPGALLAEGTGDRKLAAASMRVVEVSLLPKGEHHLSIPGAALKVDFAAPAMGHVSQAEFERSDCIWAWRRDRLAAVGTGLAGLLAGWLQLRLRGAAAESSQQPSASKGP